MKEKKLNVLYIEDDINSRLLLKSVLEKYNYHIIDAEDGLSGIEMIHKNKIDIILLDINLPGMNGFEVASKIKSIDKVKKIPMIAVSSDSLKNSKELSIISGCDGYIKKPINVKKIQLELKEYLDGKKITVKQEKLLELMREYNFKLLAHLETQILDLKRANESLSALDKLKSEFISIISHELKTPLASIFGFVELLINKRFGALNNEQNEVIKVIERNVKKLDKIVKDMVTISFIDNNIPFIKIKNKINLNKLINNILVYDKSLFKENLISIKFLPGENFPTIGCDDDKIFSAVNTLLNNSIFYSSNKGLIKIITRYPSRRIKDKYGLYPKDYIEILIEDARYDMTDEQLKKIFDKFGNISNIEKINSSEKNIISGEIGLGLTIVRGIIINHNGYIWVEKMKRKGIRFVIILPKKINNKTKVKQKAK